MAIEATHLKKNFVQTSQTQVLDFLVPTNIEHDFRCVIIVCVYNESIPH